jgi:uncharacterized protein DUF4145
MRCPHCTTSIHPAWGATPVGNWIVRLLRCPACKEDVIEIVRPVRNSFSDNDWIQVFPRGSSRGPLSPDVPSPIAQDYLEAAAVLSVSPKASAALSRRCLQAVLLGAGYDQRDLAKQIDAVLKEPDPKKSLPSGVHSTLDAIRNFGNFSAHPITDQTTVQIIDVDNHEAEYCLDILDAVFDHYYVRPAEAQRKRAALDAKLKAAGKPPSK